MQLPAALQEIIFNKLHTDQASDQSAFVALRSCCKQLTATANHVLASISFCTADLLRVKPFIGKLSCIKKIAVYCTFASDFSPSLLFLSTNTICSQVDHLSLYGLDATQSHSHNGCWTKLDLYEVSLPWCCNLTHLAISNCRCTVSHMQTHLEVTGSDSYNVISQSMSGGGSGHSSSSSRRIITTDVRWNSFLSIYSPFLESLELRHVTPHLTAVSLSWLRGLKRLTCVGCMDEHDLDLGGWEVLEHLDCSRNRILVLNVSSCFALQTLNCSGNRMQHLFVDACTGLRLLRSSHNHTVDLILSTCVSLQELDCSNSNLSMLCLPFEANLLHLNCSCNSLAVLTLFNNAGLCLLNCSWNRLSELHLEGYSSKLIRLDCSHNALGSLTPLSERSDTQQHLDSCVALQYLDCSHNHLRVLRMASSPALLHLECSYNTISSLTLSVNRNLQFLACSHNSIKELGIPQTASLQSLDCASNRLFLLDLSHNTNLLHLNCQKNQLKRLVLGACASLQSISCSFNMLQEMDSHLVQLCKSLPQHQTYNT